MATRSTIAIRNEDGTVTGIYCHWDGYIDHNGRILVENYNTEEQARELLALGNLSVLGVTTDLCKAYGRDMQEEDQEATTYHNRVLFLNAQGQEFNYIFERGMGWAVNSGNREYLVATALSCMSNRLTS